MSMCISIVDSTSPATLNQQINTLGGLGIASVVNLSPIDKCPLNNICITDGQWGADKCQFTKATPDDNICGILLHHCDTGIIEDWKPATTKMITCVDDVVCFEFDCWPVKGQCSEPSPIEDECDPCVLCARIRKDILALSMGGQKSSERKGGYAASFCKAQIAELRVELRYYQKLCNAKCGKSGRRWRSVYRPSCTSA